MPVLYRFEPDEAPLPFKLDDDSDSWWGGVYKSAVAVAIAATIAANAFAANLSWDLRQDQEEIPAKTLRGQPDEDFWANPVPPLPATLRALGAFPYLPDSEEIPAGSLRGMPDEDFWQNAVRPFPGTIFVPLPIGDRDEYWNPPPPSNTPEEDFWQNPVRPLPASIFVSLPLGDNDEVWAPIPLRVDEDYCIAAPRWIIGPPLPPPPDDEVIAGIAPNFTPDEDYWILTFSPFSPFGLGDSPIELHVEEDYWQNAVAPTWTTFARFDQFAQHQNEIVPPAGAPFSPEEDYWPLAVSRTIQSEPTIVWWGDNGLGIPIQDEDFWSNPVAAAVWRFVYPEQWSFDFESLAPPVQDEDYWKNSVAPIAASLAWPQPFRWDPGEIVPQPVVPAPADEDFAVIAPYQSAWRAPLFVDVDEIPALFGTADEDYWQNPVPAIAASLWQPLPLSFDPNERFFQAAPPDEDYWQPLVRPAPGSIYQPLPISFDAAETIPVVDEDYWQNPVLPAAALLEYPQQWIFDSQEPRLFGQFDEDFWANPARPVPRSMYVAMPLGDPDDAPPTGGLRGQPDEDFWANPVFPIQASLWQSLPYFHDEGLIFVPVFSNVAELEAASAGPQVSLLCASVERRGVTR